jgi:hypothetical protein
MSMMIHLRHCLLYGRIILLEVVDIFGHVTWHWEFGNHRMALKVKTSVIPKLWAILVAFKIEEEKYNNFSQPLS